MQERKKERKKEGEKERGKERKTVLIKKERKIKLEGVICK